MKIAVIGIGCYYPGAENIQKLWENILTRRKQFRKIPDQRLPLDHYYSTDRNAPDKTYGHKAALIDGYRFDWAKHNIPKAVFQSTDIAHWIALDTALEALFDSGYTKETLPAEKTGVIVGNTLTGEITRSNLLRLRWPFVHKSLMAAGVQMNMPADELNRLAELLEARYKSPFPAITEDSLAGGLSNTIAGRICNYLNLNGGGYTVDGACSSSLLAIATTMTHLANGEIDMGITGGVDISLDPFELIGFAKAQALSSKGMYVYDRNAQGFIPGEGAGFVVLKRYEDALRDQDYVYAVVNGWGVSSDGKGGLIAPSPKGQSMAIKRAYQKSTYGIDEIDFIEGHGTGTRVGDVAELSGISLALGEISGNELRPCGVTSIKSIIGHTKAAAGVAGFLKTVLAVNQRVVPPTAGCKEPNKVFDEAARHLYPVLQGQIRSTDDTVKAGVTGAGFGGINCHITLASGDSPSDKLKSVIPAKALLASYQESELFVFDGRTRRELHQKIVAFKSDIDGMSTAELPDLAFATAQTIADHPWRAAIVAGALDELEMRTDELLAEFTTHDSEQPAILSRNGNDMLAGYHSGAPKIGFLYPGQGSQLLNSAESILARFEKVSRLRDNALKGLDSEETETLLKRCHLPIDRAIDQQQLAAWEAAVARTEIAQPAICLTSILWTRYLQEIGIEPHAVGGHSLGELSAFYAAGVIDAPQLVALAAYRGKIMAQTPDGPEGAMLGIACNVAETSTLLAGSGLRNITIANINTPSQTVVSGTKEEINQLAEYTRAKQIISKILPVSNGFHSPLMAGAAQKLRQFITDRISTNAHKTKLFSSVSGKEIEPGMDPAAYLSDQVTAPVDFIAMSRNMASQCDIMIEVGPKDVLTKCIRAIYPAGDSVQCYAVEPARNDFRALNRLVGACFLHGQAICWQTFYHNRLVRPFEAAAKKSFIVNPCETESLNGVDSSHRRPLAETKDRTTPFRMDDWDSYFETRKQFFLDVIKADMKAMLFPGQSLPGAVEALPQPVSTVDIAPPDKSVDLSSSESSVETSIFELVAQFTGFERSQLSRNHKLLDDLNLDSIKSAALVGNIAKELDIKKSVDPIQYANAAIGELITLFSSASTPSAGTPAPSIGSEAAVFELVGQFTGFDPGQLSRDHKLLDDLNLDSIKSAALVGNIAQKLHIDKTIDPIQFANASLGELIDLFFTASPPSDIHPVVNSSTTGTLWIRNFTETLKQSSLGSKGASNSVSCILILPMPTTRDMCEDLRTVLEHKGYNVKVAHEDRIGDEPFPSKNYHLVVPLYEQPEAENGLRSFLSPLISAAKYSGSAHSIVMLQLGLGTYSSRSFARTLHLENPEIRIKVIEMTPESDLRRVGETLVAELQVEAPISVAIYDHEHVRHEPLMQLSHRHNYVSRDLSWNLNDTILVTGGAKGITKACALGFAAETCAKLAIVGRSRPDDPEVVRTLSQVNQVGINCRYYACDITDIENLRTCVRIIASEMGPVTGIIHGAGLNHPKAAGSLTLEEVYNEIAPKVIGAKNLIEIFNDSPPKMFAAFSSIIGITGMPGNAAYGFSNEALTNLLKQFKQQHPGTQILSLAYSVWGETGMGVHMGSAAFLAGKGIMAIPTEAGVARFVELMENKAERDEVVVTANLGNFLDTWQMIGNGPAGTYRFLEDIRSYLPGVELKARVELRLERDDYLKDHQWRGSYMFPTVFGLEAMAQAVLKVTGKTSLAPVVLTDITLERPIVVDAVTGKGIEISALVREQTGSKEALVVDAWISTEDSNYEIKHFSATFTLNAQPSERRETFTELDTTLSINPKDDLYGWLLFQGEQFQRIQRLRRLNGRQTVFDTRCRPEQYVLGDPFCRDSLLHAVQLPIPKDICLPVRIEKLTILSNDQEGDFTAQATIQDKSEDHYWAEVCLCDPDGYLVEELSGYKLKILEHHEAYPTAESLADPAAFNDQRLQDGIRALEEALPYRSFYLKVSAVPGVDNLPAGQRHNSEAPFIVEAMETYFEGRPEISTSELAIARDSEGKPFIDGAPDDGLSLSHDNGLLLTALGRGAMGCDLQTIAVRSEEQWRRILTPKRMTMVNVLKEKDADVSVASTRLWTVLEVLKKIGVNSGERLIEIAHRYADIVVFSIKTKDRQLHVATWPVKFALGCLRMVAALVTPSETGDEKESSDQLFAGGQALTGPQDQAVFTLKQPLSFKDTGNLGKGAYFSNYFMWMGKVRELPLKPVYTDLIPQFTSGQWGLVTNHSKIDYFDEATSHDIMETRTWIGPNTFNNKASFPLCYEWHKIMPNGERRLVAAGEQSTSWVEIVGHGLVELRPTPDYLNEFFSQTQMLPQNQKPYVPPIDCKSPLASMDWGEEIYSAPAGPQIVPMLEEVTYQTTLEDANLVGNVYFANYPIWQGRIRDQFFYSIVPQFYTGNRYQGELFCVQSRVDHLREAMPFDQIVVRMSLKTLYTNGMTLWFDYYRKNNAAQLEKLATGTQKAVWVTHDDRQQIVPTALPVDILEALCRRTEYHHGLYIAHRPSETPMHLN